MQVLLCLHHFSKRWKCSFKAFSGARALWSLQQQFQKGQCYQYFPFICKAERCWFTDRSPCTLWESKWARCSSYKLWDENRSETLAPLSNYWTSKFVILWWLADGGDLDFSPIRSHVILRLLVPAQVASGVKQLPNLGWEQSKEKRKNNITISWQRPTKVDVWTRNCRSERFYVHPRKQTVDFWVTGKLTPHYSPTFTELSWQVSE